MVYAALAWGGGAVTASPHGQVLVVLVRTMAHTNVCTTPHLCRGGGLYQQEHLYEFCDRHGLMVWQEVMAACNPYPMTPGIIHEVKGG